MKHFKTFFLLTILPITLLACKPTLETPSIETNLGYEHTLFDDSFVHTIDVRMAGADWADLLANPVNKTKYKVEIEIDGEVLKDVSFATKGNSSLFIVAAEHDNARYSYRVNFGKFAEGQTYHGLDKLSLNNCYSDATYMKDYFSYEIFRQIGVPAPLTSFVWLTVNGEERGLYMAVEDVDNSFLGRINEGKGVLYKPENEGVALTLSMIEDMRKNGLTQHAEAEGADLIYKDENPMSYPDIFEHVETYAEEKNHQAVIAAMKSMAEMKKLDAHLNTDEIIRYFAAHNFVLNYDSYTGTMLHNLILFEHDGRLSVLPWDYNAAFGAFRPVIGEEAYKDATNLINQGIDTPLIGAEEDRRPLWRWIVRDENYRKQYHEVMDELITTYFESGAFTNQLDEISKMLLPYVEKDPTAFYTPNEYRNACNTLKQFVLLRTQSVRKQLDGTLSTSNQTQSEEDKVNASKLPLLDMGGSFPKGNTDSK